MLTDAHPTMSQASESSDMKMARFASVFFVQAAGLWRAQAKIKTSRGCTFDFSTRSFLLLAFAQRSTLASKKLVSSCNHVKYNSVTHSFSQSYHATLLLHLLNIYGCLGLASHHPAIRLVALCDKIHRHVNRAQRKIRCRTQLESATENARKEG